MRNKRYKYKYKWGPGGTHLGKPSWGNEREMEACMRNKKELWRPSVIGANFWGEMREIDAFTRQTDVRMRKKKEL